MPLLPINPGVALSIAWGIAPGTCTHHLLAFHAYGFGPDTEPSPTTKYPAGGIPALAWQKARAAPAWV